MFRFLVLSGFICISVLSLSNESVIRKGQFSFLPPNFKSPKVISSKNDDSCNDVQRFIDCNTDLAHKHNLTSLPRSEADFVAMVDSAIQTEGVNGFESICENFAIYKTCVGDEFDSCTSVQSLQNNSKLTLENAEGYSSLAQVTKYECGPVAFEVIVGHWECIIAEANLQQPVIVGCINQYVAEVNKNSTNVCEYTQDYIDCYLNAMDACEADVAAVLCTATKIAFSVSLPQCIVKCPTGDK